MTDQTGQSLAIAFYMAVYMWLLNSTLATRRKAMAAAKDAERAARQAREEHEAFKRTIASLRDKL